MMDSNSSRVCQHPALDEWRGISYSPPQDAAGSRRRAGSVTLAERISKHEACHAIAGISCGFTVTSITINRNSGSTLSRGGGDEMKPLEEFSQAPLFELVPPCADDFTADEIAAADKLRIGMYGRIILAMAGTAGERIFFPDMAPLPAPSDMQKAMECAKLITTDLKAALTLLDFARADVKRILIANKYQVEIVAAALLKEGTLDAEQIKAVISGRPDVLRRKRWDAMAASADQFMAMTGGLRLLTI